MYYSKAVLQPYQVLNPQHDTPLTPSMLNTTKVTTKYQATLPQAIREKLGITKGDRIIFELEGERVYIRKVQPLDLDYLQAVSGTLDEWASAADEEAYRDL